MRRHRKFSKPLQERSYRKLDKQGSDTFVPEQSPNGKNIQVKKAHGTIQSLADLAAYSAIQFRQDSYRISAPKCPRRSRCLKLRKTNINATSTKDIIWLDAQVLEISFAFNASAVETGWITTSAVIQHVCRGPAHIHLHITKSAVVIPLPAVFWNLPSVAASIAVVSRKSETMRTKAAFFKSGIFLMILFNSNQQSPTRDVKHFRRRSTAQKITKKFYIIVSIRSA